MPPRKALPVDWKIIEHRYNFTDTRIRVGEFLYFFFAFVCTLARVVVASSKPYPKNTRIRVGDACQDFLQTSLTDRAWLESCRDACQDFLQAS
jgi:hypothetical protein